MVTDKNCQIHFIHPAVIRRQPSLGIRDHKREKGKSLDVLQTFRVQETWLRNQKPGPDLLEETYKEYINYTHPYIFLPFLKHYKLFSNRISILILLIMALSKTDT